MGAGDIDGVSGIVSGDEAAFVTGVLAAAAVEFRRQGDECLARARGAPETIGFLNELVGAGKALLRERGTALTATATAINAALQMRDGGDVAVLDEDKLAGAVHAFGRFTKTEARRRRLFDRVQRTTSAMTGPAGRA